MSDRLFVRVRGRVQGPYDFEQLKRLVKRGQLSRMHEVSVDGNAWQSAATYSELFRTESARSDSAAGAKYDGHSDASGSVLVPAAPADEESSWYYAHNNQQHGPITLRELQNLAASETLSDSDLVWHKDMPDWVAAKQIDKIWATPSHSRSTSDEEDFPRIKKRNRRIDNSVLQRTLSDSTGWTAFIAICSMVMAAALIVLGIFLVVTGARDRRAEALGAGFTLVVYSLLGIYQAALLNDYTSAVRRYVTTGNDSELDSAHRKLKAWWVFWGIVIIVMLVNLVGVCIWVFSAGILLQDVV